jgi:hypothetical protein
MMKTIVIFAVNPALDKSGGVEHVVDRKLRCDPPCYESGSRGINTCYDSQNGMEGE